MTATKINILYDGSFDIAIGKHRRDTSWKNKQMSWTDFVQKVSETHRTAETYTEYLASKKPRQDEIKDIGGFVGGYLSNGRRKNGNVVHRQLITLDVDFATKDLWREFMLIYDCAGVMYSTHKHSAKTPRYRLIIPLDREVMTDEYTAISRRIAGQLGIELFDHTTFQPTRLMYWPSTSKDGEYEFKYQDGAWLSADEILSSYHDWTDSSEWPVSAREGSVIGQAIKKQGDPLEKIGVIGAFCRTYTIHEVIDLFLGDVYEHCDVEGRYTYKEGSTSAGLVTYDDKFAYSHHGTDPISGKLCNAFDLVRIHKFGLKDEDVKEATPTNKRPSFLAMEDFATQDKKVVQQIGVEKLSDANIDFIDTDGVEEESDNNWMSDMDIDRKGNYLTTVKNIRLILQNDRKLKGRIVYDELSQKTIVIKTMPWEKSFQVRMWNDDDWGCLRCYLAEEPYNLNRTPKLEDAMSLIKINNGFHPIKQFLKKVKWDGEDRVDCLLVDYLGAEDSEYVRAVTRKTLVAAVARVFKPGIKFDHVLTLVGKQGIGKSTIIRKLSNGWYTDTFNFHMLRGKEAYEQLQGVWLVEIGEMAGLKKAEVEAAKNFITSTEDTYRPAYGRETVTRKRQCVFFGTTNNPDFLRRANGNRRFWPVDLHAQEATKDIFDDLTAYEIEQVWAEAVEMYNAGEALNLSRDLEEQAFAVQEMHEESDEQIGLIEEYLNTLLPVDWDSKTIAERASYLNYKDDMSEPDIAQRDRVCAAEIWCECFKKAKGDLDRNNSKYIHELMREMKGWELYKTKMKFGVYGVQIGYVRKESLLGVRCNVAKKANESFINN